MVDNKTLENSMQEEANRTVDDVLSSYLKNFKLVTPPSKNSQKKKSGVQIGILVKPLKIPPESLDGIKLKLNSAEVIEVAIDSGENNKTLSCDFVNSDEKGIGNLRKVFTSSGSEGNWVAVQPQHHVKITETITIQKVDFKHLLPTQQPPEIPKGLRQRFTPFGSTVPLTLLDNNVEIEMPSPKKEKKRKKKHKDKDIIKPEQLSQSEFPQSVIKIEPQVTPKKKKKERKHKMDFSEGLIKLDPDNQTAEFNPNQVDGDIATPKKKKSRSKKLKKNEQI